MIPSSAVPILGYSGRSRHVGENAAEISSAEDFHAEEFPSIKDSAGRELVKFSDFRSTSFDRFGAP
jgi:hypothetical protein